MIDGGRVRVPVPDVERSLRFYIETLGVKLVAAEAATARVDFGGGFEVDLVAGSGAVTLVLRIRGDFEEALHTYENRGLVFERGDSFAECTDPHGHTLRFESA